MIKKQLSSKIATKPNQNRDAGTLFAGNIILEQENR